MSDFSSLGEFACEDLNILHIDFSSEANHNCKFLCVLENALLYRLYIFILFYFNVNQKAVFELLI